MDVRILRLHCWTACRISCDRNRPAAGVYWVANYPRPRRRGPPRGLSRDLPRRIRKYVDDFLNCDGYWESISELLCIFRRATIWLRSCKTVQESDSCLRVSDVEKIGNGVRCARWWLFIPRPTLRSSPQLEKRGGEKVRRRWILIHATPRTPINNFLFSDEHHASTAQYSAMFFASMIGRAPDKPITDVMSRLFCFLSNGENRTLKSIFFSLSLPFSLSLFLSLQRKGV